MYLDFSAKVLSLQWSSKEIMFSKVHPHSTGDKHRRLSGPAEFFLSIYGPRALGLGHKSKGKNLGRNLQYGPRTQLVRGMYPRESTAQ